VDDLATNHVGHYFITFSNEIKQLQHWRNSDCIWKRRTAIIFQLKYKQKTNLNLISEIVLENQDSKEFFINKAMGWALREIAKWNPVFTKQIVEVTALSNLTKREALRHISN
jgi:3-methyladenine DNA glycosylase AlkD